MKGILLATVATVAVAGAVQAAGVERTTQSVGIIFKQGSYAELSFGSIDPSISGVGLGPLGPGTPTPGADSGDMAPRYSNFGAAFSHQYNDQWSVALIFDQPWGANVDYPVDTGFYAQGSTASLDSNALTGVVKYKMPSNVSVYGGLRYQTLKASAVIPFVSPIPGVTPPYEVNGDQDNALGYLVGVAWERPDIAARIALTYNSAIEHKLDTTESSVIGTLESTTKVTTPQSLNLEFQTGIAPDTLLFGYVRWVDWSEFEIRPEMYALLTGGSALAYNDSDYTTYSIGVGHRFNESWAASIAFAYEPSADVLVSNLGPTDGSYSVQLGGSYTYQNMEISAGLRYTALSEARTQLREGSGIAAASFEDNDAIGLGVKVGFTF